MVNASKSIFTILPKQISLQHFWQLHGLFNIPVYVCRSSFPSPCMFLTLMVGHSQCPFMWYSKRFCGRRGMKHYDFLPLYPKFFELIFQPYTLKHFVRMPLMVGYPSFPSWYNPHIVHELSWLVTLSVLHVVFC